ncbi:hypothetical protein [Paenibacillus vulneris]|uniref:Uncharacterized protein n=1 Tax=Paenibacillus vulneris TaxID=1133364 RepID=A0ABW3UTY8_9BACL
MTGHEWPILLHGLASTSTWRQPMVRSRSVAGYDGRHSPITR